MSGPEPRRARRAEEELEHEIEEEDEAARAAALDVDPSAPPSDEEPADRVRIGSHAEPVGAVAEPARAAARDPEPFAIKPLRASGPGDAQPETHLGRFVIERPSPGNLRLVAQTGNAIESRARWLVPSTLLGAPLLTWAAQSLAPGLGIMAAAAGLVAVLLSLALASRRTLGEGFVKRPTSSVEVRTVPGVSSYREAIAPTVGLVVDDEGPPSPVEAVVVQRSKQAVAATPRAEVLRVFAVMRDAVVLVDSTTRESDALRLAALLRDALGLAPRPPVRMDSGTGRVVLSVLALLMLELLSSTTVGSLLGSELLAMQPLVLASFVGGVCVLMYLSYFALARARRRRWRRALAASLRAGR
jgi:hypothetical protein